VIVGAPVAVPMASLATKCASSLLVGEVTAKQ
jgi:hypothetical protein